MQAGYTGAVKLLMVCLMCVGLDAQPKQYDCHRASASVKIDGRLDDPAWSGAAWTTEREAARDIIVA